MPEMAARTLRLCLPPQKTPHAVRLLQEARLLADSCDVFIKIRLNLHEPHKRALQFRCLSTRKISQFINTGAKFLVYDTL